MLHNKKKIRQPQLEKKIPFPDEFPKLLSPIRTEYYTNWEGRVSIGPVAI